MWRNRNTHTPGGDIQGHGFSESCVADFVKDKLNLAIPQLGTYPRKIKTHFHTDCYVNVHSSIIHNVDQLMKE